MDPKISVPWASATSKRKAAVSDKKLGSDLLYYGIKKIVSYSDDMMDEDLNDAADKLCKGIMDYISSSPTSYRNSMDPYLINESRLDPQGSWSSCSRFEAFSGNFTSKFNKFMESYSRVGIYTIEDVKPDHGAKTSPIEMLDDEDVLQRYKNFKRFDTVVDYTDHLFSASPMEEQSETWTESIRKQWEILQEGLPETIFVRVYKDRMDLLRAVFVGAKGTPYHDGLFFFDVYFPPLYPLKPPAIRYHSGGFGINPHLFECGEFRLDIAATWTVPGQTIWMSYATTVLEILVSIQDRVLNADPLFLQPGFLDSGPSVAAEYLSLLYNEHILIKSLKTMMHIMNKPPKNFEVFVVGHFRNRVLDILKACKAYMKGGLQVGNKESCFSIEFQNDAASCFTHLVSCFKKIGATEADFFTTLSAPTSLSVFGSSTMYKPEHSRSSASTSTVVLDVAYKLKRTKLSEVLQTRPSSPDSSIINERMRAIENYTGAYKQIQWLQRKVG